MRIKKAATTILCMAILFSLLPARLLAATMYLPDVTAEMSKASYWADRQPDKDLVLADTDSITKINKAIMDDKSTKMNDLAAWSEDTYKGPELSEALKIEAEKNAKTCYEDLGAKYDKNGKELSTFEDALTYLYNDMIANCVDSDAAAIMPTKYAICTNRSLLRYFPSYEALLDAPDKSDPDFDVQPLSAVNLGEPMVAQGVSEDGKFWHVTTEYMTGWIAAEDIAFCKDKTEWLKAWQFASKETLVVYDGAIYTEASNSYPQTSKKLLGMGTRLKLADPSEWTTRITNRTAYNNHVVWLPVRNNEGGYEKQLALVSEQAKVSEGFLPVTASNLAEVMFNQLGKAYGWGGMLDSQDCSGYVQNVYRCFGLNLARDTEEQAKMPVWSTDLTGKTDQQKIEIIKTLPLGATLTFKGHTMLYLGNVKDKLYVISSTSSMRVDGTSRRVRGAVVNTLDVTRPNKTSWLTSLYCAQIPYLQAGADIPGSQFKQLSVTLGETQYVYSGKVFTPSVSVKAGSRELDPSDYTLAWSSGRKNVGSYSVKVTLKNRYKGTATASFKVIPKGTSIKKVSKGKSSFVVRWKKQGSKMSSKKITGYQVQYATNKKFTTGCETLTIKKKTTTSKKVTQLKRKKKYYVRVRTYMKVGNKNYYSKWSSLKTVKTK